MLLKDWPKAKLHAKHYYGLDKAPVCVADAYVPSEVAGPRLVTSDMAFAINEGCKIRRSFCFGKHGRHFMPSKTPKQARFFAAVAHSPSFAKKAGVPQSVGRDFNQADTGTGILKKPRKAKAPGFRGRKTRSYTGA